MRFLGLPHACVLLLAGYIGVDATSSLQNSPQTDRVLRAATKRSDLYRRSMRISQKFESEMAYVEKENGWNGKSTFASQVKVTSQKAVFTLEEVEHHLQDVQCGDGSMKLHFVDASSARDAKAACHGANGGLVITSHESCNKDRERAVYHVHGVSFAEDGEALELSVSESSWEKAFDTFDISFGHTTEDHLYRRHADFAKIRQKRQASGIAIPTGTPDNVNDVTFNLSSSLIDTTFAANEYILAAVDQVVPIPSLPIEIGCRNCTTTGRVELTQGAIKIDASEIDLVPDVFQGGDDGKEITSVITGGFMELEATGLGAHLELFARPTGTGSYEVALFALPILGFIIPGVGKAGAHFEPRIAVDFTVSGGFEINYGIDVAVPDGANFRVELTDISKSGVSGFPGSTLTPLPVTVNVTAVDILLGLAFKPTIPIGFEFTDKLKADITVSMNLPRLDAQLSTNGADCGNQTQTNSTLPGVPITNTTGIFDGLTQLGPLVLVEANISITADVAISLALPLLASPFGEVSANQNIFSWVFPLVTSCINPADAFTSLTGIIPAPTSSVVYPNTTAITSLTTTPPYIPASTALPTPPAYSTSDLLPTPSSTSITCDTASTVLATPHSTPTVVVTPAPYPTSIVAPPYDNTTTPCDNTATVLTTTHSTSTQSMAVYASDTAIPTTSLMVASGYYGKAPVEPTQTPSASNSSTSTPTVIDITLLAIPTATALPSSLPPLAPIVSMSTGFLSPSNSSTVPTQSSSLVEFTGAAVPGAQVPRMRWRGAGWQVGVLGMSVVFGMVML